MDFKHSHSSRQMLPFIAACIVLLCTCIIFGDFVGSLAPSAAQSWLTSVGRAKRTNKGDLYMLGVGKGDITGPVVELNFMGYAYSAQVGTGLRQRVFARAFIIGSTAHAADRFVYLNIDTSCGDTAIRNGILDGLAALGPAYSVYGQQNVAVVGTHQHSGPGGWLNYLLPQVTNLGFSSQAYQAIVDGSVLAIQRAHESLTPGYLDYANTTVTNANINRSLYAYMANPASERAQYDATVDQTMSMLRFQRESDGKNIGLMTWFSVHGTSAYENNTHVSGDNKGVAQYLFEKAAISDSSAAEGFVAGFSQSSVGDTSPNTEGAWCDDGSGQQCSYENSTCADGTPKNCRGRGPEFQNIDLGITSCYEIGNRQYKPAKALYDDFDAVSVPIRDKSVKAFHFFQDMRYHNFTYNGQAMQTCPAALGYSFAAGTTDGPGPFDFTQADSGSPNGNPIWTIISKVIKNPSAAQTKCQGEKPILLDTGELEFPYAWSPNIVDIQMFRVGQMIFIVSPSEVTTMSGRRWKRAIAEAAISQNIVSSDPIMVIGSPANTYAHYLTTPEEYSIQRYEGASTLYGPNELPAYINLTVSNLHYLSASSTSGPDQGSLPPDNRKGSFEFISPVVQDNPTSGHKFGDVLKQPHSSSSASGSYPIGSTVNATFVAANPRNNLRLEGTFISVEQYVDGQWHVIRDDWDWYLSMTWTRDNSITGTSHVEVSWETGGVGESVAKGIYRFRYYGDSKALLTGRISAFEGMSGNFTLE